MANETSFPILLIVLFVFCCIQQGLCIKCWVCRSDSDPKCADPFDNTTVPITDCKQEPDLEHLPGVRPTMCRKIRQKAYKGNKKTHRRNNTTASASCQTLDFNPTIIIYFISNVSYGDKGTLYDSHTTLLSSKIRESMTVLM
ncbi:uncharacterized protein LOC126928967 isoform X2 [Bombus affinis]|uniref:uncharacterized protein LOC126928967 isoform X2 n=1 Tax=Bombus affinis TaxID=309941 RepID=UPI0021B73890|nr:uncharacterized protein LOC126928967 isoform X2 [Bombus affinis]